LIGRTCARQPGSCCCSSVCPAAPDQQVVGAQVLVDHDLAAPADLDPDRVQVQAGAGRALAASGLPVNAGTRDPAPPRAAPSPRTRPRPDTIPAWKQRYNIRAGIEDTIHKVPAEPATACAAQNHRCGLGCVVVLVDGLPLPKILFDLVGAGVWDVDRGRSRAAGDHHGRMAAVVLRLAYLGVTNGICDASPAAEERSGQGPRDPRSAAPDHGVGTATR
jgi:hypothetical protein